MPYSGSVVANYGATVDPGSGLPVGPASAITYDVVFEKDGERHELNGVQPNVTRPPDFLPIVAFSGVCTVHFIAGIPMVEFYEQPHYRECEGG